jgi:hypothetical protein
VNIADWRGLMKRFLTRQKPWLILLIILLLILESCSQQTQRPGGKTQPAEMPSTTPSPTVTSTMTISPTATPTATAGPTATKTLSPTNTPPPTPVPGPEVTTYLPNQSDLPQCIHLQYLVRLNNATVSCTLAGKASFSISIAVANSSFKTSSLALPSLNDAVDFPTFGDGSIAGKTKAGDKVTAIFVKHKTKVTIVYYTPRTKININDVINLAQMMESKDPGDVNPPLSLAFTANQNLALAKQLFSQLNFWILTNGAYQQTNNFAEGSTVCMVIYPHKTTRDTWSAYLYDKQEDAVVNILVGEIYYQKACGGLTPTYSTGTYKAGDAYEIRLVVGNDWVATFPFVTK